jgi:hypothetical protein
LVPTCSGQSIGSYVLVVLNFHEHRRREECVANVIANNHAGAQARFNADVDVTLGQECDCIELPIAHAAGAVIDVKNDANRVPTNLVPRVDDCCGYGLLQSWCAVDDALPRAMYQLGDLLRTQMQEVGDAHK